MMYSRIRDSSWWEGGWWNERCLGEGRRGGGEVVGEAWLVSGMGGSWKGMGVCWLGVFGGELVMGWWMRVLDG